MPVTFASFALLKFLIMKCKTIYLLLITVFLVCVEAQGQYKQNNIEPAVQCESTVAVEVERINFFIISKRTKGRFDVATKYNVFRTKLKMILHGNKFTAIVARDGNDMCKKVEKKLKKRNAHIGTIWFDSHGKFKKGYALFTVGSDEYNHLSIKDSTRSAHFKKLSSYIGPESSIVIGSCYGGATFKRLVNNYADTALMRGDSLMIFVGNLLQNGVVYGSESWVMSKPGLFLKKKSLYGNPGRKIFRDSYFKPAWEHIGKWNKYVVASKQFMPANALTLNSNGKLIEFHEPHYLKNKYRKRIASTIEKLRPGILKI